MFHKFTILALGDSLTEGFGIPAGYAFPDVLEDLLREKGYPVRIINLGLSGDTASGGLRRLERYLNSHPAPDAAIVELGANDGLMLLDPWDVEDALSAILKRLSEQNIATLFTGMQALFCEDKEYAEAFAAMYPKLAEQYGTILYPFFLEGVYNVPELNLWDELHPNVEGTATIAANILPYMEQLIQNNTK